MAKNAVIKDRDNTKNIDSDALQLEEETIEDGDIIIKQPQQRLPHQKFIQRRQGRKAGASYFPIYFKTKCSL